MPSNIDLSRQNCFQVFNRDFNLILLTDESIYPLHVHLPNITSSLSNVRK